MGSAAFELVQASQALQAVQAVQPLLSSESPPMMTPLKQDPSLLSSMDPAQIARAVQHCPIPLDSALVTGWPSLESEPLYQVGTNVGGQLAVQYSTTLQNGNGVLTSLAAAGQPDLTAGQQLPLLTDCSQHAAAAGQPITSFGHQQLLLHPQFTFGPGNGL